jgi:hypothetical protein
LGVNKAWWTFLREKSTMNLNTRFAHILLYEAWHIYQPSWAQTVKQLRKSSLSRYLLLQFRQFTVIIHSYSMMKTNSEDWGWSSPSEAIFFKSAAPCSIQSLRSLALHLLIDFDDCYGSQPVASGCSSKQGFSGSDAAREPELKGGSSLLLAAAVQSGPLGRAASRRGGGRERYLQTRVA